MVPKLCLLYFVLALALHGTDTFEQRCGRKDVVQAVVDAWGELLHRATRP